MIYPVIMAGGRGERFWPMSRIKTPKQLLAITSDKTMIQETVERLGQVADEHNIIIVTNAVQASSIKDQLCKLAPEKIVAEPCARNTAPCIMLAAAYVAHEDENGVMVILPADHVIHKHDEFAATIKDTVRLAEQEDALFTIGITPAYPATGYGYIHVGEKVNSDSKTQFYTVNQFREKPDINLAERFVESGEFLWNSGIFVWRVNVFIDVLKSFMPSLYDSYLRIRQSLKDGNAVEVVSELYPGLPNISIDYGIMEKAQRVIVAKSRFDWDDVGAWDAVAKHFPADNNDNVAKGKFVGVDCKDCIVFSENKLVAGVGIENLVVVVTDDAVLVCDKSRAQDVKALVKKLNENTDLNGYL